MSEIFFDIHGRMLMRLDNRESLPEKKILRGPVISLVQIALSPYGFTGFSGNNALRLVTRYQGDFQGHPTEVACVYLDTNIKSGIIGTTVIRKQEEKCPCFGVDECDQAHYFAGYLFNTEQMFYGLNQFLAGALQSIHFPQGISLARRKDLCVNIFQPIWLENGINTPEYDMEVLRAASGINITYEQMLDIHEIAKLAYRAGMEALHGTGLLPSG